jgi:hypothetical protein
MSCAVAHHFAIAITLNTGGTFGGTRYGKKNLHLAHSVFFQLFGHNWFKQKW